MTANGTGFGRAGHAAAETGIGAGAARFTALAGALPASVPFVGPEALERRLGIRFKARLGANESVFGPSPIAVEAMRRAAGESWAYGDPELLELREAIGARLGLTPDHVAVGEGIDGLLGLLVRLTCEPGDGVVSSLGAYPTFNYHVAGFGARLDLVPYEHDREDVDALIERARAVRPKLLYFANPDNPTGSFADPETVERLIAETPPDTILVLDEAYGDFAPAGGLVPPNRLRPNLLRFRTFSKAYGLAGARIGYVFGEPAAIAQFDKVRNHFGVSRMTQAGALAALADEPFLRRTVTQVAVAREALAGIARQAGLSPLPSAANFVALDCGGDGAYARRLLEAILGRGVFVRMPGVAPLDRLIRVTVGTPDDLALFAEALAGALAEVGRAPAAAGGIGAA